LRCVHAGALDFRGRSFKRARGVCTLALVQGAEIVTVVDLKSLSTASFTTDWLDALELI
jgi:hypothetical protein